MLKYQIHFGKLNFVVRVDIGFNFDFLINFFLSSYSIG